MLKTSNENIIYLYLTIKQEIVNIDSLLTRAKTSYEDKKRHIDKIMKNGNGKGNPMTDFLAKMMGIESKDMIEMTMKSLDDAYFHVCDVLKGHLQAKISILKDLESAFDILKDELPEVVEKYKNIVMTYTPDSYGNYK